MSKLMRVGKASAKSEWKAMKYSGKATGRGTVKYGKAGLKSAGSSLKGGLRVFKKR